MSTRKKLLFAVGIALSVLSIATAALANTIYFPLVGKSAAPTPTRTPTITPTPSADVIITHIEADPPGPDIENEYVRIHNQSGRTINMTGWTLQDNTSATYKFPTNFSLASNREVKVWSKAGKDSATELFWGRVSAVWDNFKDCGYLYDGNGRFVDDFCYQRAP